MIENLPSGTSQHKLLDQVRGVLRGLKLDVDNSDVDSQNTPRKEGRKNTWGVELAPHVATAEYRHAKDAHAQWIGFKVSSKIFEYQHRDRSIRKAKEVLDKLRQKYGAKYKTPFKSYFYVHVGNGTMGFSTKVMKNIAAFFYTYEQELRYLYKINRRGQTKHNLDFKSMGNSSPLKGLPFSDALDQIYNAADQMAVVRATHQTLGTEAEQEREKYDVNMAVNMVNLLDGWNLPKTISFQQWEGVNSSADAVWWTGICLQIVSNATKHHRIIKKALRHWFSKRDGMQLKELVNESVMSIMRDIGFTKAGLAKLVEERMNRVDALDTLEALQASNEPLALPRSAQILPREEGPRRGQPPWFPNHLGYAKIATKVL